MALLLGSLAQADQPLRLRFLRLALFVSRVDHGLSGAQQQDEDRHSPTEPANVDAHGRDTTTFEQLAGEKPGERTRRTSRTLRT